MPREVEKRNWLITFAYLAARYTSACINITSPVLNFIGGDNKQHVQNDPACPTLFAKWQQYKNNKQLN